MNHPYNMRSWLGGECGQVLPLVAVAFVVLLGMAGLAIDVGHVFYCDRALQSYADAAALAGAGAIRTAATSAAVVAASNSLSPVPGSVNAHANLPNVTIVSGFPVLKCLTTLQNQGIACVGAVPYHALQVQLQVAVPMYFAALFGIKTMNVTASATAVLTPTCQASDLNFPNAKRPHCSTSRHRATIATISVTDIGCSS